ncbi:MAG: GGDEF domain-containing protein [Gammaproteobacteria bacterium]|nr:GGDEF domain-containing protein [Gammaproteobacteria bacterium]
MVIGIIVLVAIIGIYVDTLLKDSHYKSTNARMLHGFNRLSTDLAHDLKNLHKSLSSIKSNEGFHASIDLINNYQDKIKYNAILLDEEKKIITKDLLSRVKLSLNDRIYLYDDNQELIAFVIRQDEKYLQAFISYENGNPILYSKFDSDETYIRNMDKSLSAFLLNHNYTFDKPVEDKGAFSFHHINDLISVKAHLSLFTPSSTIKKAHIELEKIYDNSYFSSISSYLNMHISGTSSQTYSNKSFLLSKVKEIEEIDMVKTSKLYIGVANINTENGLYYYHVRLDRKELLETLTKVRNEFILITLSAVVLILMLFHFFFQQNLYSPLNNVMAQINGLKNCTDSHDELKTISENVNQLLSTAFNDELTGTYNRHYFKENITKILDENQGQTGIIFFDIDHFKQINDTYGHDTGDIVLKELAKLVQYHIRKEDKLIRWGGEEFIIIVRVANSEELIEIAEHLRKRVESNTFSEVSDVTCSFGCYLHSETSDIMASVKLADEFLYRAKTEGRNRVAS